MKHELLYETQSAFETTEGTDKKVTSIVPGVAYINENGNCKYNKNNNIIYATYDISDTLSPTRIFRQSITSNFKDKLYRVLIDKVEARICKKNCCNLRQFLSLHDALFH